MYIIWLKDKEFHDVALINSSFNELKVQPFPLLTFLGLDFEYSNASFKPPRFSKC